MPPYGTSTILRIRIVRVYTVGHSTRPITEFIEMLKANAVERLVDVRTVPRSRHNPQYNREELSAALDCDYLRYLYMPGLGGLSASREGRDRELRLV